MTVRATWHPGNERIALNDGVFIYAARLSAWESRLLFSRRRAALRYRGTFLELINRTASWQSRLDDKRDATAKVSTADFNSCTVISDILHEVGVKLVLVCWDVVVVRLNGLIEPRFDSTSSQLSSVLTTRRPGPTCPHKRTHPSPHLSGPSSVLYLPVGPAPATVQFSVSQSRERLTSRSGQGSSSASFWICICMCLVCVCVCVWNQPETLLSSDFKQLRLTRKSMGW